ncbi:MAG: ATP-binding protein, partial [Anaerolineales bacterium]|nr:ATP-binding protein [Anaerolineales bacterium]
DGLLNLSRVVRATLHREKVNLSELARSIVRDLQQRDPQRRVEFAIDETPDVEGDATLLRVVLQNLLDNSWKFTKDRSLARIEFGAYTQGGELGYFVRDNGVGFDQAFVDKLFAPFQRLHTVDEFPGTGIGLATVKRIIHRHRGRVWAEGESDEGATFYFTIH